MLNQLRPAIVSFAALTLITGAIYPAIVTGIASLAFPEQAAGSLVRRDGKVIGSKLIAQPFIESKYFWPRPSAANYDAAAGAGSNLGPNNPALPEAVASRVEKLRMADPASTATIPADLVTTSGSGLDPHLSRSAVEVQIVRVARARGLSEAEVRRVVEEGAEAASFGILGETRVNVLNVNLALDRLPATVPATTSTERDDPLGYRWRGFAVDPK